MILVLMDLLMINNAIVVDTEKDLLKKKTGLKLIILESESLTQQPNDTRMAIIQTSQNLYRRVALLSEVAVCIFCFSSAQTCAKSIHFSSPPDYRVFKSFYSDIDFYHALLQFPLPRVLELLDSTRNCCSCCLCFCRCCRRKNKTTGCASVRDKLTSYHTSFDSASSENNAEALAVVTRPYTVLGSEDVIYECIIKRDELGVAYIQILGVQLCESELARKVLKACRCQLTVYNSLATLPSVKVLTVSARGVHSRTRARGRACM
ncbi:unnamed protein product [Trichogramma brassicae]|uniref:Uncharacterized protein n=1 Tax=Trichogramma brassicae TaxID=86971 RepID=A0A6H5ISR4_9HYME|nr:unnamed protein product [Trichogramma brassicae]